MSTPEQRVCEAFRQISLPPQVKKRTLEAIESARSRQEGVSQQDTLIDNNDSCFVALASYKESLSTAEAHPSVVVRNHAACSEASNQSSINSSHIPNAKLAPNANHIPNAKLTPNANPAPNAKLSRRAYGRRVMGALAACLVLVALCFSGTKLYFDETAYVGIDINPSIELGINRFDIVVSTKALNDDGRMLLDAASITGKAYDKAVAELTNSAAFAPYLQEDAYLEISVTASNDRQAEDLRTQSSACLNTLPCKGSSNRVNEEDRDAALSAGMGVGRYRAALELIALDPELTLEDCATMNMKELQSCIKEASGQASPDSPGFQGGQGAGGNAHHGRGAGKADNAQASGDQSEEDSSGQGGRFGQNGQAGNSGSGHKGGE